LKKNVFSIRSTSVARAKVCLGSLIAMLHGPPAQAHEFWLDAVSYTPKVGAMVPIVLRNGQNFLGNSYPFQRAVTKRFSIVDGRSERRLKAIEGDDPAVDALFPTAGLSIVVFERAAEQLIHATFAKFLDVLDGEGVEFVPAQHRRLGWSDANIKERFARYTKALIKVGDGNGVDRPVGLRFEIVVMANPYQLGTESAIPVQVLHNGVPVHDVLVKAFNRADGQSPRLGRTDAAGRVDIGGVPAGEVLLSAVIMEPLAGKDGPGWSSLWATTTFKRP
jgi:cobalt/nickel transport protein